MFQRIFSALIVMVMICTCLIACDDAAKTKNDEKAIEECLFAYFDAVFIGNMDEAMQFMSKDWRTIYASMKALNELQVLNSGLDAIFQETTASPDLSCFGVEVEIVKTDSEKGIANVRATVSIADTSSGKAKYESHDFIVQMIKEENEWYILSPITL